MKTDSLYQKLINGNKKYAMEKRFDDPEYFKTLSLGQKPDYLWIGCSDSRVPANEVTGTQSGEIFVHRNIANVVIHTDFNVMSVLDYAVNVLKVKHIIVCGHYGCGGVRAALTNNMYGFVDSWLRHIKDVYHLHQSELNAIMDEDKRADRLTELNVIEQVRNLAQTKIVQNAWHNKQALQLHAWVYGLNNGLITELKHILDNTADIDSIYRYEF
ncbi:MAG: carbonic anhydrase [Sphingobacteriia bacterium]|jgi:carbonic anhydrase|nr:carbonic anhydrase [Sphingobacteriia bacterium]